MAPPKHINGVSVAVAALILLVACFHCVDANYQQQFMAPQNAARARLRLRPLMWDAKLARYAQWWANQRRGDQTVHTIVWKSTQRIGCAHVICNGGGGVLLACSYDPPGNFLGRRPY
ncbi:hypothetical protein Bca52824_090288 [Brassica carinata]|uniref:SCP domain-containing protein n=1 Tax=Brassica carinata TaxID=52824 RepID=A0A8X7NZH2_BRACI|nr:hypothetical protein Bca52824_090288 [Brassica carinata]